GLLAGAGLGPRRPARRHAAQRAARPGGAGARPAPAALPPPGGGTPHGGGAPRAGAGTGLAAGWSPTLGAGGAPGGPRQAAGGGGGGARPAATLLLRRWGPDRRPRQPGRLEPGQ